MKKRICRVLILLFLGILFFIAFLYLHTKYGFSIPCIFHEVTGFYCPGCGITRCILAILKFDFALAFRYNSLVFVLLPIFIPYFLYKLYLYIFNKEDHILHKIPRFFWYSLIVIALLFAILRNMPMFSILAPLE